MITGTQTRIEGLTSVIEGFRRNASGSKTDTTCAHYGNRAPESLARKRCVYVEDEWRPKGGV
jgi:hypothetical protein